MMNQGKIYDTNCQIRFKTLMLRSSLCDYSDAYITVQGTITVANAGTAAAPNNADKKVIFKNCAPFTSCTSRIVDDAHNTDVALQMYNSIEYSDNYPKTSGNLWQYYKD